MDFEELKAMFNKMYEGQLSSEARTELIEWMEENAELLELEDVKPLKEAA